MAAPNPLLAPQQQLLGAFAVLRTQMTQAGNQLTEFATTPFQLLRRSIAAVQSQIVSFVQFANPAAVIRFKMAWEDLQGVIGRVLLPVLNAFTMIVQKMADYLNAASGPAKGLVLVLASVGIAAVSVAGAFAGLISAMVLFQVAAAAATGGLSAIVSILGAIVGAVVAGGAVGAGLTVAFTPLQQLREIIDKIGNVATQAATKLGEAVFPVLESLASSFGDMLATLKGAFESLASVAAPMASIVGSIFENMMNGLSLYIQIFASQVAALKPVLDLVAGVIGGLSKAFSIVAQFVSPIIAGIGKLGSVVVQAIVSPFTAVMGVFKMFEPIMNSLQSLFGAVGSAIGALLSSIGSAIGSFISSGVSVFVNAFKALEPMIIRIATYIEALAIVIKNLVGGEEERAKAPGKAPPAVRQAQVGSLQSFISRQYVSAFQAGSGNTTESYQSEMKNKTEDIRVAAKEIAKDMTAFLNAVKNTGETASTAVSAVASTATVAASPALTAARVLLSTVTGK